MGALNGLLIPDSRPPIDVVIHLAYPFAPIPFKEEDLWNGYPEETNALAYHDLTTQIPREVYLAAARGTEMPRVDYPPIRLFRFSKEALDSGTETHIIEGVPVKIFNPEKTLADCFKLRAKVGLDTAIEALKMYLRRKNKDINKLITYAKICRVENVMRPYLYCLL